MMRLLEFAQKFGTEQQCREHFILQRKQTGVVCKKCKGTKHYWLEGKQQFQCASCSFRTCLKSGTLLEHSRMSFQYWYTALYLMTYSKKGISAKELQRQLGHKRYEPLWLMMHKIRSMMGKKDEQYKLTGAIEADGAYFETLAAADQDKKCKRIRKIQYSRGKGSERVTTVLVMAESLPGQPDSRNTTHRNPRGQKLRYIRLRQLSGHQASDVITAMRQSVDLQNTDVVTDMGTEMSAIKKMVRQHDKVHSTPQNNNRHLHWVNIVIANAKTTILGVYHRISSRYIQNYLNEFAYRTNRRFYGLDIFERLLNTAVINL